MKKQKLIAVIGGSEASPQEARLAEEVGRELAAQNAVLVCGGLGGVMEAACRGASSAGGITIGILPGRGKSRHSHRDCLRPPERHPRSQPQYMVYHPGQPGNSQFNNPGRRPQRGSRVSPANGRNITNSNGRFYVRY